MNQYTQEDILNAIHDYTQYKIHETKIPSESMKVIGIALKRQLSLNPEEKDGDEPYYEQSGTCRHCGEPINVSQNFCPYCGQKIRW